MPESSNKRKRERAIVCVGYQIDRQKHRDRDRGVKDMERKRERQREIKRMRVLLRYSELVEVRWKIERVKEKLNKGEIALGFSKNKSKVIQFNG